MLLDMYTLAKALDCQQSGKIIRQHPTSVLVRGPATRLAGVLHPPHMQAAAAAGTGCRSPIQHCTHAGDAPRLARVRQPAGKGHVTLQAPDIPHLQDTKAGAR